MADWWATESQERYWCEITDRVDIGADLKCPQADKRGSSYWSYSLIREVQAGDVIFHYSTNTHSYVGASVAGAPLEERPIAWQPHGTVGRGDDHAAAERPGWWLPLYGFEKSVVPLTLAVLQEPTNDAWIRNWVTEKGSESDRVAAPVQLYPGRLRGSQGYLTKMPLDFVERWSELRMLADAIDDVAEQIEGSSPTPMIANVGDPGQFASKAETPYDVVLAASVQHRTREHERLLRVTAKWLGMNHPRLIASSRRHPLDMLVSGATHLIVEAKTTRRIHAGFAIRQALGQLYEYRYFIGPQEANLVVLLDAKPEDMFIDYLENHLGIGLLWWDGTGLAGDTQRWLPDPL